jgi:hypothetical protein
VSRTPMWSLQPASIPDTLVRVATRKCSLLDVKLSMFTPVQFLKSMRDQ